MADNVIRLVHSDGVGSDSRVEINNVLAGARKAKLDSVVVVGESPDGNLYIASSHGIESAYFTLGQAMARMVEPAE